LQKTLLEFGKCRNDEYDAMVYDERFLDLAHKNQFIRLGDDSAGILTDEAVNQSEFSRPSGDDYICHCLSGKSDNTTRDIIVESCLHGDRGLVGGCFPDILFQSVTNGADLLLGIVLIGQYRADDERLCRSFILEYDCKIEQTFVVVLHGDRNEYCLGA
jgi:hypothetical protein